MTAKNEPFFDLLKLENLRPKTELKEEIRKVLGEGLKPEDFGAVGDGVTDDGPAIQLAVDRLAELGGGNLKFNSGVTYKVNQQINITSSNINVDMTGATILATEIPLTSTLAGAHALFQVKGESILYTNLSSSINEGAISCDLDSVSNIQTGDLIYFIRSGELWYSSSGAQVDKGMINRIKSISGNTVTFEFASPLSFDASNNYLIQCFRPISNISFRGGRLYGGGVRPFPLPTDNVINGAGLVAYAFNDGVTDIDIELEYVEGFQGFVVRPQNCLNVTVHGGTMRGYLDTDPDVVEGVNSGFYGFFPYFCLNVVFRDCTSYRTRHMQDGFFTQNAVIENLRAYRNHRPPFGSHEGTNNFVFIKCFTNSSLGGIQWRGLNWTVMGCYLEALTATVGSRGCYDTIPGGPGAKKNGKFIGNHFYGERSGLLLQGSYENIYMSGNTFKNQSYGGSYAPLQIESIEYDSLISVGDYFNPDHADYGWLATNTTVTSRKFTMMTHGVYENCGSRPGRFFSVGTNSNVIWKENINLDDSNPILTDSLGTGHSILTPNYADAGVVI